MRNIFVTMALLTSLLIMGGCSRNEAEVNNSDFTRQAALVKVTEVANQDITVHLNYSGSLQPEQIARISPEIPGKLKRHNTEIGDVVKAGELLGVMDNRTLSYQLEQVRAGLTVAKANLADAKKNWERTQNLYQERAVSQLQFEKTRLGYQAADAQLKQAQANFNLLNYQYQQTNLRAPFAGVVTQKNYHAGDMVSPGPGLPPIYTVMDISRLKLGLQVPQQEIGRIRKGQKAYLTIATSPNMQYPGEVTIVNIAADEGSRTFYVEAEFDNRQYELRPGSFGHVFIEVNRQSNTLVIPRTAIVDGNSVFVVKGNIALKRTIILGLQNNDQTEVLGGLQAGDKVIFDGVYSLADSSLVRIIEER